MANNGNYSFNYDLLSTDMQDTEFPIQKSVNHVFTISEDVRWPVIVDEFFCFLGSIYGYPISAKKYYEAKQKEW